MEIIVIVGAIVAIAFVFGLLSREKGDGVMDTLGSGCSSIINIIFVIILIVVALVYFNK
jgi:preprotein translocase subunit SecG